MFDIFFGYGSSIFDYLGIRIMKFSESSLLFNKLKTYIPNLSNGEEQIKEAVSKVLKLHPEEFGANLKRIRVSKGINQIPFANQLGVAQTTYSSWETGSHIPRVNKIESISELLQVDVGELFSPSKISKQISIPLFNKNDFYAINTEHFYNYKISHHEKMTPNNFPQDYQFAFYNNDEEMIGKELCIPKNSIVYCSSDQSFTLGLLKNIQKIDGKVVLLNIAKGPALLRQIKYDGNYIRIKAWNTELEDKICLFDENQTLPKGNEKAAQYLNYPLVVSMVEIFGIAKKVVVDLS